MIHFTTTAQKIKKHYSNICFLYMLSFLTPAGTTPLIQFNYWALVGVCLNEFGPFVPSNPTNIIHYTTNSII